MLLNIRITSLLKEKVDGLVSLGHYPDFNTAAVVALENLVVAEAEHASPSGHAASSAAAKAEHIEGSDLKPGDKSSVVFGWRGTPTATLSLVKPLTGRLESKSDIFPIERWLFGQRNRLLPLKVNARLLLTSIAYSKGETALPSLADELSEKAVVVGAELIRLDQLRGNKKDESLATAFPTANSDKSRQRFADQFVATENGKGELSGLLVDWGFAVVERNKGKSSLYPTEACVAFANLTSPLLDSATPETATAKFSDEELTWALSHVSRHVPVEAYAFRTLLRGIAEDANDPSKLDQFLRKSGAVKGSATSDEFVATQRAGAISRMADLDLIRRVRDGVRISYDLTPRSRNWLNA